MALKQVGRSGLNPLAYMGVEPSSPPYMVTNNVNPTALGTKDSGFDIGDLWLNTEGNLLWALESFINDLPHWILIGSSSAFISSFITSDNVKALPDSLGFMYLLGGAGMFTTGAGDHVFVQLKPGLAGQLYISGGAAPALGYIVPGDASISIVNKPGSIEIEVGTSGVIQLNGDTGFATPDAHFFTLSGSLNISTAAVGNTLNVLLNPNIMISGTLDIVGVAGGVAKTDVSGEISTFKGADGEILIGETGDMPIWAPITSTSIIVTPGPNKIYLDVDQTGVWVNLAGDTGFAYNDGTNAVNLHGSTNIVTTASADQVVISLKNSLTLLGTITLSSLGAGVVFSSAGGLLSSSNGTNGQLLIVSAAGIPAWKTVTSTGGTITLATGANSLGLSVSGSTGLLDSFRVDNGDLVKDSTPYVAGIKSGTTPMYDRQNVITSAAGNTITISLRDTIYLLGSMTVGALTGGPVVSNGSGLFSTPTATDGQLLIGATPGAPVWSNITSGDSSIVISEGNNTLNIEYAVPSASTHAFNYCQVTTGSGAYLGSTGWYYLGQSVVLSKIFDNGSNVYPGSGAGAAASFTCPKTGKYFLNMCVTFYSADNSLAYINNLVIDIVTSNRTYYHGLIQSTIVHMGSLTRKFSTCADMDIGDTATFKCMADLGVGTGTITVKGGAVGVPVTWISGYLITA